MPGTYFCFTRANRQFEVIDCYMKEPIPDDYAKLYAEVFHDRREGEAGPTFTQMLRDRIPLVNYSTPGSDFTDTALYEQIFRPLGLRHGARVAVLAEKFGHGTLSVSRPEGSPPFLASDEQTLLLLAQHLGQALELERQGKLLLDSEIADNIGQGVLVLDKDGSVLNGCPLGLRLFHEATRVNDSGQQPAAARATLPRELAEQAGKSAGGGEVVLRNHRGQFSFKSAPLRQGMGAGMETTGFAVTVRRQGSIASRLWLESARFPLSSRERQIAVLIGVGYDYQEISVHLALTRNTTVSYVRRTYEKLGVSQREQLIRMLLAAVPNTEQMNGHRVMA